MRSRVGEDQHRTHRVGIWSRRADQNRDVVAQQTDSRKSALTPTPTRSRDVGGVTALPHIRTLRCFVPPQRTYVDANPIAMPQHSGTAPPRWGCRYPRPRQKVSGPCATSTVPVDVQSWRSSSFCTRSPQDRRRHIRTGTGDFWDDLDDNPVATTDSRSSGTNQARLAEGAAWHGQS